MRSFNILLVALLFFTLNANAKTCNINLTDTLKKGKNFNLFNKSVNIDRVDISKNKKSAERIVYIRFGIPKPMPTSNTVSGTVLQSNRKYTEDGKLPLFDKIDIIKGNYADIKIDKETNFKNIFTLTNVEFPIRLKLLSGKESVEFELNEFGKWDIDIELKNN